MMWRITKFFWQLCLLRQSPANLPSSTFATAAVFFVYLLIGISSAALRRPEESLTAFTGTLVISVAMQIVITLLLLEFKGARGRFQQTWMALLGASSIISILLILLTVLFLNVESDAIRTFADSAIWICIGWWLAIAGYIYHKAVDISVLQGSVIAFVIEFMSLVLALSLFPR